MRKNLAGLEKFRLFILSIGKDAAPPGTRRHKGPDTTRPRRSKKEETQHPPKNKNRAKNQNKQPNPPKPKIKELEYHLRLSIEVVGFSSVVRVVFYCCGG